MSKAKEFYKQDHQRFKAEHSRLRKYLLGLSIARLIAFVLIITTIIVFLDQSIYYMLGIGIPLILTFFWLLTKYSDKKTEENYAIQRMQLNELEEVHLESSSDDAGCSMYVLAVLIPLLGIILGLIYIAKKEDEVGKALILTGVISNIVFAILFALFVY